MVDSTRIDEDQAYDYMYPMMETPVIIAFLAERICRFQRIGIGMMRIARSIAKSTQKVAKTME